MSAQEPTDVLDPGSLAATTTDDVPVGEPQVDLVVTDLDVLVAPGDLREGVDLVLAGGRVVAVEPVPSPSREMAAEVLDGRGLLAVPGLVNAHTHSPENPMRGLGDGLTLEPWLATLMAESGGYSAETTTGARWPAPPSSSAPGARR